MPADNSQRLFDVTNSIREQITEVFTEHPGMGSGTGNILEILDPQIDSVIGTLTGNNDENSSGGNPTVIA